MKFPVKKQRFVALIASLSLVMVGLQVVVHSQRIARRIITASPAAAFTPGNVVVYRVGDGTGSLVNTGNAVFLDEFTPTGTLVQSIALPTTTSGSNKRLIASGTATSEGLLTRSVDGRYLTLTGYDATPGGAANLSASSAATINRVVGRVDAGGNVITTTALADYADTNNPRSAVSTNGTDLWLTGGAGGLRYTTLGATASSQLSTTTTNLRQVNIVNGQLYVSSSSGTTRIATVGTGTPTNPGQTITNLPGINSTNTPSPYSFFFADLDAGVAGVDTLYISDDTAGAGIRKFSLVSGTWTANGVITAASARGLTGVVSGTTVTLYAATGGSGATGGGTLYKFTDTTGYNGSVASTTASNIATATTNTAFRGVALAPVALNVTGRGIEKFDFDGDARTDISVWNPNTHNWSILQSGMSNTLRTVIDWGNGSLGDISVPGDYDGDGKTDVAVFRPSEGNWYIIQSMTNTPTLVNWGQSGDRAVPGDYDGDGKTDVAVWRASEGNWYIRNSGGAVSVRNWGGSGDQPVPGDYDGDGKTDVAVFRPSEGTWYITSSLLGTSRGQGWGSSTDRPVPMDYDGDNKTDLAVFRPSEGAWYVLQSGTGTPKVQNWGNSDDVPVPGFYDADGKADIAVFRPTEGNWYIINSANGTVTFQNLGMSGDVPAPSTNPPQ